MENIKTVFIYTLSDNKGNIRYVGKSNNVKKRYSQHIKDIRSSHKRNWIKSLDHDPILEVLDEVPEDNWQFWEIYWIAQLKIWGCKLTNVGIGGESAIITAESRRKMGEAHKGNKYRLGKKHSAETIIKLSESHKGQISPNKGKKASEETKQKLSITHIGNKSGCGNKGKKQSEERIIKRVKSNTGKTRTEEQKITLSEAQIKRYDNSPKEIKWTKDECFNIVKLCSSIKEFRIGNGGAYNRARKNGWLEEIYEYINIKHNKWTLEKCQEEALKYNTRNEFQKNAGSAYKKALKNKWLDEICNHMIVSNKNNNN